MDAIEMGEEMKFNITHILSRSPRLETIIMVEKFIQTHSGAYKKTDLLHHLPKKMMWGTFNVILHYLWGINKIAVDKDGFVIYIWSPEAGKLFKDKRRY